MNKQKSETPQGKIAVQTLAMPADTNANGDIFGGWLLSQMDLAGAVTAKQRAGGRITTIAIDSMVFHQPVHVGDLVCCFADVTKVGRTSMTIKIEVWTRGVKDDKLTQVTEGIFTYVAIDDQGKPRPVEQQ